MSNEPTTPVEPTVPTPEPVPPQQAQGDVVEKARYDGLVRKVEELTLKSRELESQLASKSSEAEQLKGQLAIKDTEKTVAVGERDKALETSLQNNQALEAEVANLRAMQLKIEVAKELNRPDLISILDRLPNMTDKEALTTVMTDFAKWGDQLVAEREKQLLAGVTPTAGASVQTTPSKPQSEQAWVEHINNFQLGSRERTQAMDEYGSWLSKKHQS